MSTPASAGLLRKRAGGICESPDRKRHRPDESKDESSARLQGTGKRPGEVQVASEGGEKVSGANLGPKGQLSAVVTSLAKCEQKVRKMHDLCLAFCDSEALSSKCGLVHQNISALLFSAACRQTQYEFDTGESRRTHDVAHRFDSAPVDQEACFAGAEWFHSVECAIDVAEDLISSSKGLHGEIKAHHQVEAFPRGKGGGGSGGSGSASNRGARAGTDAEAGAKTKERIESLQTSVPSIALDVQPLGADASEARAAATAATSKRVSGAAIGGEGSAGVSRNEGKENKCGTKEDLLAKVQRTGRVCQDVACFQRSSTTDLKRYALEAGVWVCDVSDKLKNELCAQDAALVKMTEHAASQIEALGDSSIERSHTILKTSGVDGLSEALACLVAAKAAYDEVYGMKIFAGQRPPKLPRLDLSKHVTEKVDANKSDPLAIAASLRDLATQQKSLQSKLRGIQQNIQERTRSLQYQQRCYDVTHLLQVQSGFIGDKDKGQSHLPCIHHNSAAVSDDAIERASARARGATAGSWTVSQEPVFATVFARSVAVIEGWVAEAPDHLRERNLLHLQEALQQELKRYEAERKDEAHFLEQLQQPSAGGKATSSKSAGRGKQKTGSSVLDSRLVQFYHKELSAIVRRRAYLVEACSAIKLFMDPCAAGPTVEGESSGQATANRASLQGEQNEREQAQEKEKGRSMGRSAGSAVGSASDCGIRDSIDERLRSARNGLIVMVQGALEMLHEHQLASHLACGFERRQETGNKSGKSIVVYPGRFSACREPETRDERSSECIMGPVIVSQKVESAIEACLEYLRGVKRMLDRTTHILLSGEVLGNFDLASTEELAQALDSSENNVECLMRMVLAGQGMRQACEIQFASNPAQSIGWLTHPIATMHKSVEDAVNDCKGVCRAVDLVLDNSVTNAVILAGAWKNLTDLVNERSDMNTGQDVPCGGTNQEAESRSEVARDGGAGRCGEGVSGAMCSNPVGCRKIELLLASACAHMRVQHPSVRRVAVVNLSHQQSFRNPCRNEEDFLVVHACPALSKPTSEGTIPQGNSFAGASTKDQQAAAKQATEGKELERASRSQEKAKESHGQEEMPMTGTRVQNGEKAGQNLTQESLGSRSDFTSESAESEGNSASVCNSAQADDERQGRVSSAKISADLQAFRPEFIFVVFDQASRHRLMGNFACEEGTKDQTFSEQDSWQALCSLCGHIVKEAAVMCEGNLIFLEASNNVKQSRGTKGRDFLERLRSVGSVLEAALGRVCDVPAGPGAKQHGEEASFLPWPMPFKASAVERKELAGRMVNDRADAGFDRTGITFETLQGTPKVANVPRQHGAALISEKVQSSTLDAESAKSHQQDSGGPSSSMENVRGGTQINDVQASEPSSAAKDLHRRSPPAAEQGIKKGLSGVAIQRKYEGNGLVAVEGKQLRAIKPHDAAIEVLRGKPEGLCLEDIVLLCQQLPRELDLGSTLPGTQRIDARSALRHALTAGCSAVGERPYRRPAAFRRVGDRFQLLQEAGRMGGEMTGRTATHKAFQSRDDGKQGHRASNSNASNSVNRGSTQVGAKGSGGANAGVKGGWHSNTLSSLPDIDRKISGMLLDLADRIPYNSVRESTAAVWDNFRVMTQSCRSAAELAQQLLWFSTQILPRVLRSTWSLPAGPGRPQSGIDAWRVQCGQCKQDADVLALLKDFECNAIDWDEVSAAFREEWAASKSKLKGSKQKKIQLSKAEELALAATTQVMRGGNIAANVARRGGLGKAQSWRGRP